MRKTVFRHLYTWVLLAIVLGTVLGLYAPGIGVHLKPLGDGFIKLIRMVVTPIIFTTVVIGIAGMGSFKRVGRIGLKAILYFEIVTTIALVIGWIVVKWIQPGVGVNADPATLDTKAVQNYVTQSKGNGLVEFFMNVIPSSIVDAFARGDIVQVLFFSVLFGFALSAMGERGRPLVQLLEQLADALMKIIGFIVKLAPIAAFGAIAYTTADLGVKSLKAQLWLMVCVYITCIVFIVALLGTLLALNGVSLWRFLKFIREEIFIVLGTASSESVLPRMMTRLEQLGCSQPVVRLVLPAGYSFNMDGSCIYLTMAAIFIAQATNTHLTLWQELSVVLICLITSKGAAGVVGSAFIVLAATLASLKTIPVEGMVLILGVDRLMAEARSLTNLIGNGVATILLSKWEGEFDAVTAEKMLRASPPAAAEPVLVHSPQALAATAAEELRERGK
ncbi:MAG TPA: dicarboxylate/amino acid:cation symporter [Verrucomicrobiae bacterium]|nr:dicarboxylate/amino acid:cation symporter [Verrucomicrobiae bacterium]